MSTQDACTDSIAAGFWEETMCRDIFPADIVGPDLQVFTGVRAFATSHRLVVWGEQQGQPAPLLDIALSEPGSIPASRDTLYANQRLECATADGTFWVNRGRGCGCHSILKALGSIVPWVRS